MNDDNTRDPHTSNLRPWKPGESGNLRGRPRGSGVFERVRRIVLASDGADAEAIARALVAKALKGNLAAIDMIVDRLDGPVVQKLELEQRALVVVVDAIAEAVRAETTPELAARILARMIEIAEARGRISLDNPSKPHDAEQWRISGPAQPVPRSNEENESPSVG